MNQTLQTINVLDPRPKQFIEYPYDDYSIQTVAKAVYGLGYASGALTMMIALKTTSSLPGTVSLPDGCVESKLPTIIPTQISNLPSIKYKLKMPIDVILEKHADETLALLPELTLCGEGDNELEAINDLKADILDLLDDLKDIPEADLGAAPKLWKQSLDLMVETCQ